MWFRGNRTGVEIWYVCWGRTLWARNADLYKTPYGVRKWLLSPANSATPVWRVGRFVITENGPEEKEHWTRDEFLARKGR